MIRSEKDIFINETEVKPNRYSCIVLSLCTVMVLVCWIITELGIFRVDKGLMRIDTILTFTVSAGPLALILFNKKNLSNPKTKYLVIIATGVFSFGVGTLITFHTTIMLLFPICMAMLYRSKGLGYLGAIFSFANTIITPILAYVLGTWDIELFKELILIGTNGTAVIEGAHPGISLLNIGKILLYIVFPRLMMIGSVTLLMFNIISIGVKHVDNQLELFKVSRVDALTGLYNQNYFKEFKTDFEKDEIIGLVFFDVNNLKKVNDSMGHEYGDLLLKRNAKSILDICDNQTSFGFRLGGDEFLMIIETGDEKEILRKKDEWEKSIFKINMENKSEYYGLECSMAGGYAIGNLSNIDNLIQEADKNMYNQKLLMKNSVNN